MSDATITTLTLLLVTDIQFMGLIGLGGAIVAAVPPSIIAWSARNKAVATSAKADTIIEKAVEIHTLTNSNLSRVTSQLEVANTKLEGFAESQRVSGAEIKALQGLVNTLVERERGVERAVKETNGILSAKSASGPLPVVDDKVVNKLDEIVTPKLDEIQNTVKKVQDEQHHK